MGGDHGQAARSGCGLQGRGPAAPSSRGTHLAGVEVVLWELLLGASASLGSAALHAQPCRVWSQAEGERGERGPWPALVAKGLAGPRGGVGDGRGCPAD